MDFFDLFYLTRAWREYDRSWAQMATAAKHE
jgi:hypothetical protein